MFWLSFSYSRIQNKINWFIVVKNNKIRKNWFKTRWLYRLCVLFSGIFFVCYVASSNFHISNLFKTYCTNKMNDAVQLDGSKAITNCYLQLLGLELFQKYSKARINIVTSFKVNRSIFTFIVHAFFISTSLHTEYSLLKGKMKCHS